MSVTFTEKAVIEVKKIMNEKELQTGVDVLRVQINSGGCSGFSYGLSFCKKDEIDILNDTQLEIHGMEYVIDNKSIPLMNGTVVDFHDEINRRGFIFTNPMAVKGCGCGNSFSV